MDDRFFEHPILNSPYDYPSSHWELDPSGQPTNRVLEHRRRVEFITPIPRPKKRPSDMLEDMTKAHIAILLSVFCDATSVTLRR